MNKVGLDIFWMTQSWDMLFQAFLFVSITTVTIFSRKQQQKSRFIVWAMNFESSFNGERLVSN